MNALLKTTLAITLLATTLSSQAGNKKENKPQKMELALTCLEISKEGQKEFVETGIIPKGTPLSTKNKDECVKVGGIPIGESKPSKKKGNS